MRLAPLRNLGHRITLELIAEIELPHRRLMSSKLEPKASRNLGDIQVAMFGEAVAEIAGAGDSNHSI